jgi:hypothetical protein
MTDRADEPLLDPSNRRRRNSYLGRALPVALVLVLVAVGSVFGVPAYRQQALIREIEAGGGWVETRFTGPDWLQGLIPDAVGGDGLTGFERFFIVIAGEEPFTDATLKRLGRHRSLVGLTLGKAQITDAGLVHLRGLANLEWLHFNGYGRPNISDEGLVHLKGMTKLRSLKLGFCPRITSNGIADFKKALPNCGIIPTRPNLRVCPPDTTRNGTDPLTAR